MSAIPETSLDSESFLSTSDKKYATFSLDMDVIATETQEQVEYIIAQMPNIEGSVEVDEIQQTVTVQIEFITYHALQHVIGAFKEIKEISDVTLDFSDVAKDQEEALMV